MIKNKVFAILTLVVCVLFHMISKRQPSIRLVYRTQEPLVRGSEAVRLVDQTPEPLVRSSEAARLVDQTPEPLVRSSEAARLVDQIPEPLGRSHKDKQQPCLLTDLLRGSWIHTPYIEHDGYRHCIIDTRQDCRGSNTAYLDYSWKPARDECPVPRLQRASFLQSFANKSIVFVGDSLARNQQQSLQCLLMGETEVNAYVNDGEKKAYNSYYPEYGVRVDQLLGGWKDYLTPANIRELAQGSYDIVVISVGSHWREAQSGIPLLDTLSADQAKPLMQQIVRERLAALDALPQHMQIIWKTPDMPHWALPMSQEPWRQPCSRNHSEGHTDQLQMLMREALLTEENKTRVHVLDVLQLVQGRVDAHPNKRTFHSGQSYDCLHWCLPGVPDTINEVIFQFLINKAMQ